jgi:ribosomal protein S27AE
MGAYIQAVGRGLRAAKNKTDCIVLDLMGSSLEHGLPDDSREYSLDGKAISLANQKHALQVCPRCGTIFRGPEYDSSECQVCGYVRPKRQDPAVRRRSLQEAASREGVDGRSAFLAKSILKVLQAGHKLGKAAVAFKVRYNAWPSNSEKAAAGYFEVERAMHEAFVHATARGDARRVHVLVAGTVHPKQIAPAILDAILRSPNAIKLQSELGEAIVRYQ